MITFTLEEPLEEGQTQVDVDIFPDVAAAEEAVAAAIVAEETGEAPAVQVRLVSMSAPVEVHEPDPTLEEGEGR